MTAFERGDVVEIDDPFGGRTASRPFLLVNTDAHPFHGEQYVAVALTTRTWYEEAIPISTAEFVRGGVPADSSIVPWGVTSPAHDDVVDWFGRVDAETVDSAVEGLLGYLVGEE